MIESKFNSEKSILEIRYVGDVTLIEVLRNYERISAADGYPRDLRILTDARFVSFLFANKDIKHLTAEIAELFSTYRSVKAAVFVRKSEDAALLTHASNSFPEKINYRVFMDRIAAEAWLIAPQTT